MSSNYPIGLRIDVSEFINHCIQRIDDLKNHHPFFYNLITDLYRRTLSGQVTEVSRVQRDYIIKAYKLVTPIKEQRTLLPEQYR